MARPDSYGVGPSATIGLQIARHGRRASYRSANLARQPRQRSSVRMMPGADGTGYGAAAHLGSTHWHLGPASAGSFFVFFLNRGGRRPGPAWAYSPPRSEPARAAA